MVVRITPNWLVIVEPINMERLILLILQINKKFLNKIT
jgi:hypothetical protein